jgi:hypothetical protein
MHCQPGSASQPQVWRPAHHAAFQWCVVGLCPRTGAGGGLPLGPQQALHVPLHTPPTSIRQLQHREALPPHGMHARMEEPDGVGPQEERSRPAAAAAAPLRGNAAPGWNPGVRGASWGGHKGEGRRHGGAAGGAGPTWRWRSESLSWAFSAVSSCFLASYESTCPAPATHMSQERPQSHARAPHHVEGTKHKKGGGTTSPGRASQRSTGRRPAHRALGKQNGWRPRAPGSGWSRAGEGVGTDNHLVEVPVRLLAVPGAPLPPFFLHPRTEAGGLTSRASAPLSWQPYGAAGAQPRGHSAATPAACFIQLSHSLNHRLPMVETGRF